MPDLQHLLLFIAAGLLLNLTPGPDVLYIASNALRSAARAGVVAGLGITLGCFVHVLAAALGLGALLAASATAFEVVKWLGAAYLVWVGVKLLVAKKGSAPMAGCAARNPPYEATRAHGQPGNEIGRADDHGMGAVFRGGFLTNVLNPKVAIFFLAFVPQFIAPAAEHKTLAFLALGVLFNINSIAVNTGWALAAAWLARRGAVQHGMRILDRVAGAMFIAFGLRLALAGHPSR